MKVAILGSHKHEADEGFSKISGRLADRLERNHQILRVNSKSLTSPGPWIRLREFDPDIVHAFSSPGIAILVATAVMRNLSSDVRVVISSLHPHSLDLINRYPDGLGRRCAPDIVLTQHPVIDTYFSNCGAETFSVPNAVDTEKFSPVTDAEDRKEIRRALGLNEERPVVLHVGHVTEERSLDRLLPLTSFATVLVIASRHFTQSSKTLEELERNGVRVWNRYVPDIEDAYRAADCYVFPVDFGNSIFQPLSVLEAVACHTPVVSMTYPSLVEFGFSEPYFRQASTEEEFVREVRNVTRDEVEIEEGDWPEIPSWEDIAGSIEEVYHR